MAESLEQQLVSILSEHCGERGDSEGAVDTLRRIIRERGDACQLAAMYLQCLNRRALERGEEVEKIAAFVEAEFAENPWLRAEYGWLVDTEESLKRFAEAAGLRL